MELKLASAMSRLGTETAFEVLVRARGVPAPPGRCCSFPSRPYAAGDGASIDGPLGTLPSRCHGRSSNVAPSDGFGACGRREAHP